MKVVISGREIEIPVGVSLEQMNQALAEKQDILTVGDGIDIADNKISVATPVAGIYTKEQYNALPEEERNKGLYIIVNGDENGGSSNNSGGVPSGFIGMWSGSEVPDGWALCDGQNGTPDLRGRFVLGENEDHTMGETGGSEEVTLTVDQMPRHQHSITGYYGIPVAIDSKAGAVYRTDGNQSTGTTATNQTGGSNPHTNMPPYYVLAYIMKL